MVFVRLSFTARIGMIPKLGPRSLLESIMGKGMIGPLGVLMVTLSSARAMMFSLR